MSDPGGGQGSAQPPAKGNDAKPKGKTRSRWLKKGLAAISEKLNVVSIAPTKRQPATTLQHVTHSLKDHEIRLVHLQPRAISDEIKCSLVTIKLDDAQYEALSYEWGPVSPELPLIMNESWIDVRENLWWALHHLQLENETRVLWIDALCINQQDTAERNHQVTQMGKIYSSATRCIAWIGRERVIRDSIFQVDDCELAIEFIKKYQTRKHKGDFSKGFSPSSRQEHDSFEFLCRRRYWTRLWIIQEILLSSDVVVQCGSHEVSWQALSNIFNSFEILHASYQFSISQSAPFRLNQHSNTRRNTNEGEYKKAPSPLADVVLQFKDAQCEDPRDTVFGLLSLARVCCREAVPANYSTSPEEICTTLLLHHIAFHLDMMQNSHDTIADIQEICHTIVFNSKPKDTSRRFDTSIASASMKAVTASNNLGDLGGTPAGKVIWLVPALEVKWAFQRPQSSYSSHPGAATTTSPKVTPPFNQLQELLKIFMDNVCEEPDDWVERRGERKDPLAANQRKANTYNIGVKIRATHLFLTDMGYSGITGSHAKLGNVARKQQKGSGFNCYISFQPPEHIRFLTEEDWDEDGICLPPQTTFLELLSWII
ncbi:hypothetical protein G7Y89_g5033 [Cudoniella acicularis]|uniref:Heterokaryon incompatibility domain-containing protein n=1 Tax=Cudoniella acicularis TaxID=354080 RepID=A0A8H4RN98_9HELO|nr:hypothetical protein G7Y89_g5033 [Cudoniella acicularis]